MKIISEATLAELSAASAGFRAYADAEEALDAAEATCYAGNRLTSPASGIETRDTVLARDDGTYSPVFFTIEASRLNH